ncbi:MAG: 50S ribosomal protein L1 [Candidatus Woesearchaeota archaeon]
MDKDKFKAALQKALEEKGKRKFTQSIDVICNLKEIELKNTEHQIDFFLTLPHTKGKGAKVCAFVGPELHDEAKKELDAVYEVHDFDKFKDKPKEIKKLADSYDYFVAQANVMPQVATVFGKVLGPRGKMPNPKAGCVVPPKASLGPLKEKLNNTIRVTAKTSASIKAVVGKEDADIDALVENIMALYNSIISHTPQGHNNIKELFVKLTMGTLIKVE